MTEHTTEHDETTWNKQTSSPMEGDERRPNSDIVLASLAGVPLTGATVHDEFPSFPHEKEKRRRKVLILYLDSLRVCQRSPTNAA